MATFQSRDDLIRAYQSLLKLEEQLHEYLNEENFEEETLFPLLEKQSEIMSKIDDAPELDEQVLNNNDRVESILESFARLREKNETMMEEQTEVIEKQMESLGQAHELLKHYLQGEPRPGEKQYSQFDKEI